jgi:hypothetical protein
MNGQSLIPLEDDPNVEPGSIMATEVVVTQYLRPDGTLGVRTHYDGDGSLSQVLGLIVLGAFDIYGRVDR